MLISEKEKIWGNPRKVCLHVVFTLNWTSKFRTSNSSGGKRKFLNYSWSFWWSWCWIDFRTRNKDVPFHIHWSFHLLGEFRRKRHSIKLMLFFFRSWWGFPSSEIKMRSQMCYWLYSFKVKSLVITNIFY